MGKLFASAAGSFREVSPNRHASPANLTDETKSLLHREAASFAIEIQGERMCKLAHFKASKVRHLS
jgi:hypothetical protein